MLTDIPKPGDMMYVVVSFTSFESERSQKSGKAIPFNEFILIISTKNTTVRNVDDPSAWKHLVLTSSGRLHWVPRNYIQRFTVNSVLK
jgi:hypothetical protein